MRRANRYVMLISSLPRLGPLFGPGQPPLSRYRLERRLALLEPRDARTLALIEDLLHWDRLPLAGADASLVERAGAVLAELDDPLLAALVTERLELRTTLAALRRRRRGDPPPERGEPWGLGRWTDHIRRHWQEPHFRLEPMQPWVVEAKALLDAGDSRALERALLALVWERLGRAGEGHYFDLPAVVVYVLRWSVIARWTGYDGPAAAERFGELVAEGLGAYRGLFEQPVV